MGLNLLIEPCWLWKAELIWLKERRGRSKKLPKSKFSRIRTIKAPETFSSASGFSLSGFHRSVPGMRPLKQWSNFSPKTHPRGQQRTKMVMRGLEERWMTKSNEITKLTITPASMFQIIERKKVKDMTAMSAHALILEPFRQKQKVE